MFPGNIMEVSKKERDEKIEHLTVKPVKLISHLVKLFSKENQIVLDAFMGSGSHGVASIQSNRKFIGIELDEKYFDVSINRIFENYN